MSDLHYRTSHSSPHIPEASKPSADLSTPEFAMASSVDDERPTAVNVRRLSTLWENHGTIHINNQPETTAIPEESTTPENPTPIEPPSPTKTSKESSHFWHPPNLAPILPTNTRPKHERTESTESTASETSQASSSTAVEDEKASEAGNLNTKSADDKGSATASVTQIEDTNIFNNPNNSDSPEEPPYHVFTKKEKWLVTVIIALAGLFSPLSSNIYFPALGAIANVSHSPHIPA